LSSHTLVTNTAFEKLYETGTTPLQVASRYGNTVNSDISKYLYASSGSIFLLYISILFLYLFNNVLYLDRSQGHAITSLKSGNLLFTISKLESKVANHL
jgi:hypothetical protein